MLTKEYKILKVHENMLKYSQLILGSGDRQTPVLCELIMVIC